MAFTLTQGHFSTEEEALAEIAQRGWHALPADVPDRDVRDAQPVEPGGVASSELHWHDFDSVSFLVSGTARVEFEDGSVMECGPGARIEAPARVLHRETGGGGRVVFGFDRPLTDFTQPVNKPASERD